MIATETVDQKTLDMTREILRMKEEMRAVILAHYYQDSIIQDIADIRGDSFELSRRAREVDADVIVFAGVHFMAESAYILNPQRTVLLTERDAGCPMADMITAEALLEWKERYPAAAVVSYVNSSAAVKALSDACCTSANGLQVVESMPQDEILFVPDWNLFTLIGKEEAHYAYSHNSNRTKPR